jgi:hypothetical protein
MSHHGYDTPESFADIRERFASAEDKPLAFAMLAHQINRNVPPGQEKARALTLLEEAMFSALRA